MKKLIILLAIAIAMLFSCNSKKDAASNNEIPYQIASGYFLKNDVDSSLLNTKKIETDTLFSELFGSATVMGPNGKPTLIDFSTQYVIPVIENVTEFATEVEPVSLTKSGDTLTLIYESKVGEKQTFTSKPVLLLIVDKQYTGDIQIDKK